MTDIEKWVEQLTGRDDEKDDMNHLRQVILKQAEELEKSDATDQENDHRLLALLSRLHREKLLVNEDEYRGTSSRYWWSPYAKAGYALFFALGIGLSFFLYQPTGVYPHASFNIASAPTYTEMRTRGSSKNVATSVAEAERLILDLKKYTIPYELIQGEETWQLRFYIADIKSSDASMWVESNNFNVQPNGWIVLKFKNN